MNLRQEITRIIYKPVRARVFYDFVASLLSISFVFLVTYLFLIPTTNLAEITAYPFLFILSCRIFGVYDKFRVATAYKKSLAVFLACVLVFLILLFAEVDKLSAVLTFAFTFIVAVLPRIFFSFNNSYIQKLSFSKNLSKKPILVVGGGGYIGTILVEKLLKQNYKVKVLDKFIYGREVFKGLKNKKNLELIEGDVSNIYTLTMAVKDTQAVVHLAGIVGDQAAAIDEKFTRHVNIVSTRMLKETVKALGITRFIFASSCSVYGSSKKTFTEESRVNPLSLYSKTKLDSEKELLHDTHDTFNPTVLRIATAFGHSRKPKFDLAANLFVAQAVKKRKILIINKDQYRCYVHVSDIADAIILCLKAPINLVSREIFNVGDDNLRMKIGDMAQIVEQMSKNKIKVIYKTDKKTARDYIISFDKIKNTLGFAAKVSMKDGLSEIFKSFAKKVYKKPYSNPYYNSYSAAKELMSEFYSKKNRKTTFSDLSYSENQTFSKKAAKVPVKTAKSAVN